MVLLLPITKVIRYIPPPHTHTHTHSQLESSSESVLAVRALDSSPSHSQSVKVSLLHVFEIKSPVAFTSKHSQRWGSFMHIVIATIIMSIQLEMHILHACKLTLSYKMHLTMYINYVLWNVFKCTVCTCSYGTAPLVLIFLLKRLPMTTIISRAFLLK